MKNILSILLLSSPLLGYSQGGSYVLKGKFEPAVKSGTVYLNYSIDGLAKKDTASVTNGTFELKGNVEKVQRAFLNFVALPVEGRREKKAPDTRMFYLEPGTTIITAKESLKEAVITGSQVNTDDQALNTLLAANTAETNKNRISYATTGNGNDSLKKHILLRLAELNFDKNELLKQFIKNNPDSYFSLQAIREIGGPYLDKENVEPMFNGLSSRLRNSEVGKEFQWTINSMRTATVGKAAPAFSQPDTAGKMVSLSDFRGKYVLIDFWASWCHPCRAENPNVLKAYDQFKDKNFTVLGISIDTEKMRANWIKAIKEDGMPWVQLIDANGTKSGAAALYGVKAIPSNFLLGPDGKIIAKNLRGEKLAEKLKEILN